MLFKDRKDGNWNSTFIYWTVFNITATNIGPQKRDNRIFDWTIATYRLFFFSHLQITNDSHKIQFNYFFFSVFFFVFTALFIWADKWESIGKLLPSLIIRFAAEVAVAKKQTCSPGFSQLPRCPPSHSTPSFFFHYHYPMASTFFLSSAKVSLIVVPVNYTYQWN